MLDLRNVTAVKAFLAAQYTGEFDTAFGAYAQRVLAWVVGTADSELLRRAVPSAGHRLGHIPIEGILFNRAIRFTVR